MNWNIILLFVTSSIIMKKYVIFDNFTNKSGYIINHGVVIILYKHVHDDKQTNRQRSRNNIMIPFLTDYGKAKRRVMILITNKHTYNNIQMYVYLFPHHNF